MNCRLIALSAALWLATLVSSCLPVPYPASEIDRDDMDSHTTGLFDYAISRDEVTSLLERSASRKEVIATLGRPLRYRRQYVAFEVCRTTAGFGVIVGFPPYLLPYNIAGGKLGCNELVLEFDDQNRLISILERPQQGEVDEHSEDMLLRTYGQQGDLVAQALWQKSRTYYTSQDVDIVRERTERQIRRNKKSKEIAVDLMSRAEDDDPEAQFQLYLLEDRKPLKWLCRAADQNYIAAQIQLGYLYGSVHLGLIKIMIDHICGIALQHQANWVNRSTKRLNGLKRNPFGPRAVARAKPAILLKELWSYEVFLVRKEYRGQRNWLLNGNPVNVKPNLIIISLRANNVNMP